MFKFHRKSILDYAEMAPCQKGHTPDKDIRHKKEHTK